MRLYSLDLSPFASRVRLQIYAKGLDAKIPCVPPPGGLGSDEYRRINPTGRVPALEVDGTVLPESTVIFEYLEDRFPTPALRPSDPLARAQVRLVAEFTDLYIVPPLVALFGQVSPAARDEALIKEKLGALAPLLDQLEGFVEPGPYARGDMLTLADCTLVPLFFFATRLYPALGTDSPLATRPKLTRWWEAVRAHDAVRRVDDELDRALTEFLATNR